MHSITNLVVQNLLGSTLSPISSSIFYFISYESYLSSNSGSSLSPSLTCNEGSSSFSSITKSEWPCLYSPRKSSLLKSLLNQSIFSFCLIIKQQIVKMHVPTLSHLIVFVKPVILILIASS